MGAFAASVSALAMAAAAQAAAPLDVIDHGASDPAQTVSVSVQLIKRNADGFDRAVAALYDRLSPSYHHWLTDADLAAFRPSAAEIDAVKGALEKGGLTVVSTDKYGFSLQARGTLGDAARVFNTDVHDVERGGTLYQATSRPATLAGAAGAYVHAVSGLASHPVRPLLVRAANAPADRPIIQMLETSSGNGFGTTTEVLTPVATTTLSPSGSYPQSVVTAFAFNGTTASGPFPDYAPKDLEAAYGLPAAYRAGIAGADQTIVLLEGFGYPTAEADANAAAKLAGIPDLKGKFSIFYPIGKPKDPNKGIETGWNTEIAIDLQSAHAIAPRAKIVIAACNGQDDNAFLACMQKIIEQNTGYVVSDSWEENQDIASSPDEQNAFEDVLKTAAAKGISFQFSTGDGGDGGLGTPVGAPGVPAVAPHATAVGGTAILNRPGSAQRVPLAWGDDATALEKAGSVLKPSSKRARFVGGGGGGESVYWPKPSWQSALPGTGRQTPDISALGDPYTGFPIVLTDNGTQVVQVGWGGTSLSSPIFTAFWALANEKAGKSLGDAGIAVAGLTSGLTDVVQPPGLDSLSVDYQRSSGASDLYSASELFARVNPSDQSSFASAVWNATAFRADGWYGFVFGLDSSLTATPGWDNATGFGTPGGLSFINSAAALSR